MIPSDLSIHTHIHETIFSTNTDTKTMTYYVNTSSPLKLSEFKKYLNGNVISEMKDLPEPDADPITIVTYKASQFNQVLIDDTSLEIEGEAIGAKVRWLIESLPKHEGKQARFVSLLGIRIDDQVMIYKGEIEGLIVAARGEPYGFLPYFQPNGAIKTLAEELPDEFNARYFAVQNFLNKNAHLITKPIFFWDGKFQDE